MMAWLRRLALALWPLLDLLWSDLHGRCPPAAPAPPCSDPLEVLPCDWTHVCNALRTALGQPLYVGPPRYPTLEEMEEWERLLPGVTAQFREMARKEAAHREWLARWAEGPRPRYMGGRR